MSDEILLSVSYLTLKRILAACAALVLLAFVFGGVFGIASSFYEAGPFQSIIQIVLLIAYLPGSCLFYAEMARQFTTLQPTAVQAPPFPKTEA
ncbi:MAG: hypothetical protein JRN15_13695 [Nitrososphaerota archaeon]|nr:hypothetical protein [Nitrososphaerota archaeon]